MIPSINWPISRLDEARSPFLRSQAERPIRITNDTASFSGASQEELEAIDLLRELSNLPEVEVLETLPGHAQYYEVGLCQQDSISIPITLRTTDHRLSREIEHLDGLRSIAAHIAEQCWLESPQTNAALKKVLLVQAHQVLRQDIFVSLCPQLLKYRSRFFGNANIRTPLEGVKILGLFLRSRDNNVWQATPRVRKSIDNGGFYWILARHKLSNMWRYFSACVFAEKVRKDDILYLGQSVLMRSAWTLEARDAIGTYYYVSQNNNIRDAMMYHFNYLTLLLVGAFDALARVAWRAYGISNPKEGRAGFHREDQKMALKNVGAANLHNLISTQHFADLMTLLHELRNTIHGAGLPTSARGRSDGNQDSLVTVLSQYQKKLLEAAQRLGPAERWGMILDRNLHFEPYTYAVTLVEECLSQMNGIAAATDTRGLFPAGYSIPALTDKPASDDVFDEFMMKRLAILG